jgi:hypothetical protein
MVKEVERCISHSRLDTLLSFCNSCVYNLYESAINPECRVCHVHHGATKIQKKTVRMPVEDEELLGVC